MARFPTPNQALRNNPVGSLKNWETEAMRLFQAGRLGEAEGILQRLLAVNKNSPAGLFLLGMIEGDRGAKDKAETLFRRCTKVAPRHVGAHINLGNLLLSRGHQTDALACYHAALKIEPDNFSLHYNIGQCLRAMNQFGKAIASFRRALELKPDFVVAASDLGAVLALTGKEAEAEALCLALTQRHPCLPEPKLCLGKIYQDQGRFEEARVQFEEALRLDPSNRNGLLKLAALLIQTDDLVRAEHLIRQVGGGGAGRGPGALIAMAELRARQGNHASAIEFMTQAIAAGSRRPQEYLTLASWYSAADNRAKAVEVLEKGLEIHGDRAPSLVITLFYNQLCLGDWRHYRERLPRVLACLRSPAPPVLEPFIALLIPDLTPSDLRHITRASGRRFDIWTRRALPPRPDRARGGGRLRIGYLSADFHQHATAYLTASLFEHHNPGNVAVHAYSYGPDEGSPTRRRLEAAFEQFVDIRNLDHLAAAQRIRDDRIDILVDLKGYTRLARTEILALGPAPIQVNWLGYPGTMAVDFMDYLIVDPTVVPPQEASAYQEALAYLPHAYAPVDRKRAIAPVPSRAQAGLPELGFVFCCFNNPRKIIPDFFNIWCNLLTAVPASVLWLFARQESVIKNLRREAAQRGVDPERIVFATRVTQEEHLARLSLADLILDTLPYNAHTTTSDALLMGVPILTCLGATFAGRVAASLLRAAGLPDMITYGLDEYQAKALHLASHPEELAALRQRLLRARNSEPYFDMTAFARHLESLYQRMWDRYEANLEPALLTTS